MWGIQKFCTNCCPELVRICQAIVGFDAIKLRTEYELHSNAQMVRSNIYLRQTDHTGACTAYWSGFVDKLLDSLHYWRVFPIMIVSPYKK